MLLISVVGGIALVGCSAYLAFVALTASAPETTTSPPARMTETQEQAPKAMSGLPVRLMIPKLKVDTKILYMGLTPDGDMDVAANNFQDVGWYQYGARPGDEGTAVIAGHVNGVRERGIFIALHTLVKGDIVTVLDDVSEESSFVVREVRTYDQNDRPQEVFQSSNGAHLNLITCAGPWNADEQRFPVRLVVFTDKIDQ